MKKTIMSILTGITLTVVLSGSVLATSNPSGTGQPNQDCSQQSMQPNGFATSGFAHAETVYAGSDGTPSQQNAKSSHAVAQYDVACYQTSQSH